MLSPNYRGRPFAELGIPWALSAAEKIAESAGRQGLTDHSEAGIFSYV